MAYPLQSDLQTYLGVADVTLQTQCNDAAIDFVIHYCNRQFVTYSGTFKLFQKNIVANGRKLMFYRDCVSITTLTNGDGTVVSASYYAPLYNVGASFEDPANASFYGVKLLPTSGVQFNESTVGYISVVGTWGYGGTNQPPRSVYSAILQIGALLYRSRSGGNRQVAQVQPSGIMLEGVDIPQIIIEMLKPFKRVVL